MAQDLLPDMPNIDLLPDMPNISDQQDGEDINHKQNWENASQEAFKRMSPDEKIQSKHPNLYKFGKWLEENPSIGKTIGEMGQGFGKAHNEGVPGSALESVMESAGIPEFSGNLLEKTGNMVVSAANIPSYINELATGENKWRTPHYDFEKYMKDPYSFMGIIGSILPEAFTAARLLGPITEMARPAGWLGKLSDAGRGAAYGGAIGENSQGDRLGSALMYGGANFLRASTKGNVGRRMVNDREQMQRAFNHDYTHEFAQARRSGIRRAPLPSDSVTQTNIMNYAPHKYADSLGRYNEFPTLRFAQEAKVEMGQLNRYYQAMVDKGTPLTRGQLRAYRESGILRDQLDESITRALVRGGRPDIAQNLNAINQRYATEMVPRISPKARSLERQLTGDVAHDRWLRENYPDLNLVENVKKGSKSALGLAGIGTAAGVADKIFTK